MRKQLLVALFWLFSAQAYGQSCNAIPATIIGTGLSVGTAFNEPIEGTEGDDIIFATDGFDIINGNGGDDVICGGDGNDIIDGGAGNDQIFGEAGDDMLNGGPDDDVMIADSGNDSCDGDTGNDSADLGCETRTNVDVDIIPVTLFADDGTPLEGALYKPVGDAGPGIGIRDVAILITHGAMGSYTNSVPRIWGLYGAPQGFTVLGLDRRDAGMDGGGGAVLFEDAVTDLEPGVDLLDAIGISKVVLGGHSQGTQNAGIYPNVVDDDRVPAVALFGSVQDGRATARDLLFSACPFACYEDNVVLAQQLVADGFGDDVIAWDTIFGQQLFRSPNNFLSFWGPDTLSVLEREITFLTIPALLMITAGDNFTPARMSQAIFDAGIGAGVDVEYVTLTPPAGYIPGDFGGNAHGFVATERAMVSETMDFLNPRVPEMNVAATNLNFPVLQSGNYTPVADAGDEQTVAGGAAASLDGTNSVDVDGTIISYFWDQTGGSNVMFDDPASATPGFTAPAGGGPLTFRLMVIDDDGASNMDTVDVNLDSADPLALSLVTRMPAGTEDIVYYWDGISASGGQPPYTFSISDGSLPSGLTLQSAPWNQTLATIWGTPSDPTAKTGQAFTVQVTDANAASASVDLNIVVLYNVGGVGCTNCHGGN